MVCRRSKSVTLFGMPGSFRGPATPRSKFCRRTPGSCKRTPLRYTYSPRFPVLEYNETQQLFFGGNFWDGRATGLKLQSPDAEQAR